MEVDSLKEKESKTEEHHTPGDKVDKSEKTNDEENVESEKIPDEIPKMSAADTQEHAAIADASRTGAIPKRYKEKSPRNITKPKKDTEDTQTESTSSQSCTEPLQNQDDVAMKDLGEKNKTLSEDSTDKSTDTLHHEVQTQQSKTTSIPLNSKPTLSLSSTAAIILKALKMETGGLDLLFFSWA